MKKIIFIILLFAISASAQVYPVYNSRDSIRIYTYGKLNMTTTGLGNVTDAKANIAINEALGKLCTNFPAYQKMDTLYMASDSDGVILPTDFISIASAFRWYDGMRIPMKEILNDSLYKIFVTDSAGNSQNKSSYASPSYYRIFGRKFKTQPIVSKADTFDLNYYAVHPRLTSDTSTIHIEPKYFDEFMTLVKTAFKELEEE